MSSAAFGDESAERDNITVVSSILPPRATLGDAAARHFRKIEVYK